MDRCEKRMGRAEKLVILLADEGVRWKETVASLSLEVEQLVGNVFLSCACISYYGAFTGQYRQRLVVKVGKQVLGQRDTDERRVLLDQNYGGPCHHTRLEHCRLAHRLSLH